MVKVDASMLRFLSRDDFRVLSAIELGMKKHDYVPVELITQIAAIRSGVRNSLSTLHKYDLIKRETRSYEGFKLTYAGYDYLALRTFVAKGLIKGIGHRIGVGKESDIYSVINDNDEEMILKIHRLGRVCFSTVRTKREYTRSTGKISFMYLSRLAAIREFAYMKALYDEGFPTPIPYEVNRHCILMSKAKAYQMAGVTSVRNPEKVYNNLMNMIVQFAQVGLVHGDFNEFNLLINDKDEITVIDFPQMISTSHRDAKDQFERDVNCIRRFFSKKLGYDFDNYPRFVIDTEKEIDLDVALKAAGANVSRNELRDMDVVVEARGDMGDVDEDDDDEDQEDGDFDEDDEDEDEDGEEEDEDEDDLDSDNVSSAQMRERRQRNMDARSKTNANQRRFENRYNEDDVESENEDEDDDAPALMMLTQEHMANMNLLSDSEEEENVDPLMAERAAKKEARSKTKTKQNLTAAQVKIHVKKSAAQKTGAKTKMKYNQNKSKDKTKMSLRQEMRAVQ